MTAERYTGSRIAYRSAWVDVDNERVLVVVSGEEPGYPEAPTRVVVPVRSDVVLVGVDSRWLASEGFDVEERYHYTGDVLAGIETRELRPDGPITIDSTILFDTDRQVSLISSVVRGDGGDVRPHIDYRRAPVATSRSPAKRYEKRSSTPRSWVERTMFTQFLQPSTACQAEASPGRRSQAPSSAAPCRGRADLRR